MATIYFVRHQAAGVLHEYPFAAKPTQAQIDALGKLCFQSHGEAHPKTDEPYWLTVVETNVLGSEIPEVPERSLSTVSSAGTERYEVSAQGHVSTSKGSK